MSLNSHNSFQVLYLLQMLQPSAHTETAAAYQQETEQLNEQVRVRVCIQMHFFFNDIL